MTRSPEGDGKEAFFEARGLTKSFGGGPVLADVGFVVPNNAVVSFVGENGAGKSTLFNILSGVVRADSGSMWLQGEEYKPTDYGQALAKGVSRVFQEQALVPNVPVCENLVLGQDAAFYKAGFIDYRSMVQAGQMIVDEAGIDVDVRRKCNSYDFSRRQAIEIARACIAPTILGGVDHPLILLDEPTSALDRRDEDAFFRLLDKVRKRASVIFVSHRLSEVVAVSDIIYVLKDGRIVTKINGCDADEKTLHGLMVGRDRVADHYCETSQLLIKDEQVVLDVQHLSCPGHYEGINLKVREGEIVGIGGLLDSGKSSLGKGIAGVEPPPSGKVALLGKEGVRPDICSFVNEGLGYVPAERLLEGIISPQFLIWNLTIPSADMYSNRFGIWRRRAEVRAATRFIEKLAIRSGHPRQLLMNLSGGNQQKVVLARWIQRRLRVLVLDNPTRGVDAGAKEEIYRLLRELTHQGVAILLITDELLELIGMSNRIIILQNGRISGEYDATVDAKPTERELVAAMLPGARGTDRSGHDYIPTSNSKSLEGTLS